MLERAALSGRSRAHAYLMLLRIEVAAFHPAMPPPVTGLHDTEMAVPERKSRMDLCTRPADSSLWPCSSPGLSRADGR